MIITLLVIGAGGFLGAISRYLLSTFFFKWNINKIPLGTLIINVSGSFAAGVLFAKDNISETQINFLMIGFLGSFTTFSTFNYELLQLGESNGKVHFLIYGAAMYAANILAAYHGYSWSNN
ncbi:fluoride efflux transporter FluC [Neobacillus rhizophilus]|uniref:Fluoride-specific ion channel FluC n=1 Tax=Neobacillus rhizophilus TaxID=2833579 RepID=A0A942U683_9BACI|nr:CrcB family protein [Neobacillus rhizophilus]MBS4211734.1 CrcB family protein [Neobacillus rhizophilus]